MRAKVLVNPDLLAIRTRAKRRDVIGWRGRDGAYYAATRTVETIKAAMLAVGTTGRFALYSGRTSQVMTWPQAVILRRNTRIGY